ncbi:MAG: hypothetical protein JRJ39_12100 [Deltaproteobacteria bacterium]|nr:hypothetical protein [Deltaproteobacteria bacterium]
MSLNYKRLDLLLQYILAVAGENDPYERELGMIHLIKYTYLADLAYSRQHNGETFTGLPWKFHHFGPWSVECFQRIEPALSSIGANQRTIESQKYDDFVRWSVDDDELFDRLGDQLDLTVMGAIQKYMRMFGTDTYALLDFVYKTAPMLSAAPEELLDFKVTVSGKKIFEDYEPESELTVRQKKLRRQKFLAFKKKLNKKLEQQVKENRSKTCPLPPRYDDVFFDGLSRLDAAAGNLPAEGEFLATFSEDIWKSKARHDPELS